MNKFCVFVYMLMRDASLKQRIPCMINTHLNFRSFFSGKKCALYTGKYSKLSAKRNSFVSCFNLLRNFFLIKNTRLYAETPSTASNLPKLSEDLCKNRSAYSRINTVFSFWWPCIQGINFRTALILCFLYQMQNFLALIMSGLFFLASRPQMISLMCFVGTAEFRGKAVVKEGDLQLRG